MTSPLSPLRDADVNSSTPTTARITKTYSITTVERAIDENATSQQSSPFGADVKLAMPPQSPTNTSPLRQFKARLTSTPPPGERPMKSPRKLSSPEKRFPVRASMSPEKAAPQEASMTMEDALQTSSGLKTAIKIFEDDDSDVDDFDDDVDMDPAMDNDHTAATALETNEDSVADLTMLSTFSAVPDMTMFAKIGHSPSKYASDAATPATDITATPASKRSHELIESPSPTPRRNLPRFEGSGNTTNLLVDFTEQFNSFRHDYGSPTRRRASPTKSQTLVNLLSSTPSLARSRAGLDTPARMTNLLDFDIPPAPTPRSLPTVTPRELESLKSTFLSEISSLKASLSGKEAEVQSLKTAVGDAEKRVGESMEQLREVRALKEHMEAEKEVWEKRGREMEAVLRSVKEEIVHGDREREALEGRLEESEKRREAAEMMAQEAESKLAGVKVGSQIEPSSPEHPVTPSSNAREVEIAVEKVARELHTLYKSKHETKVAALKKSYENRWERKVHDLEAQVAQLSKDNEELKTARDATISDVVANVCTSEDLEALKSQAACDAQVAKELEAKVQGLAEELKSVSADNDALRRDLETERVEKGELVAAVEEMIALQSSAVPSSPAPAAAAVPVVDSFRSSIARASGLRPPNFTSGAAAGESRIGRPQHERPRSTLARPESGGAGLKSGIMSSIEKMGSYK